MKERKENTRKRKEKKTHLGPMLRGAGALMLCLTLIMAQPSVAEASVTESQEPTAASNYSRTSDTRGEQTVEHSASFNSARSGKTNYSLPGVQNKNVNAHKRLSTVVNGRTLSEPSFYINNTTYVPMRSVLSALGISDVRYNSGTRAMTVRATGMDMSVSDGAFVTYVNSRPFFAFSPAVIMSDGRMYLPASTLTKATGTKFLREEHQVALSGSYKAPSSASAFYREDEVFWLARIIQAESGGESLLGQISVGDVILNRVKSGQFPNTIYGVIFDKKYGVQFSPAANGTIYNTPSYTATLAAKICLEGTSLSDNAMYFINPRLAPNSWVSKNRPYAFTIGNHDFYL